MPLEGLQARVRQTTLDVVSDGVLVIPRANKRSELVIAETVEQMIIDGRVFIASNVAQETAEDIGNPAYANTEPALLIDVPAGTSMKMLEFEFKQGGTVSNGPFGALVVVDDKIRYTSGGVEVTPRNFRIAVEEPNSVKSKVYIHSEAGADIVVLATPLVPRDDALGPPLSRRLARHQPYRFHMPPGGIEPSVSGVRDRRPRPRARCGRNGRRNSGPRSRSGRSCAPW